MKSIQIIISGVNVNVNKRVQLLLDGTSDLEIVAEARNGEELLNKLKAVSYDLVLLDISMPGKDGLEVLKEIKLKWEAIPVMIFTMMPYETYAARMFENGALAYVSKRTNPEQLLRILRIVAAGNTFHFPHRRQLLKEVTT